MWKWNSIYVKNQTNSSLSFICLTEVQEEAWVQATKSVQTVGGRWNSSSSACSTAAAGWAGKRTSDSLNEPRIWSLHWSDGRSGKGQTASCYPKGLNRNSTKKEGRAIAKNGSPFSIIQIAAYSAVEALPEHLTRFPPAVHASRRFAAQQSDLPDWCA